jgi:H+/Cl- antiporter ClcA
VIRNGVLIVVTFLISALVGNAVGDVAALPFHGTAHTAVWAVVGSAAVVACGYLIERRTRP